jgi:hypothetical protein
MNNDFAMPDGLSEDGQKAWQAIVTVLMSEDPRMSTGGCKAFRTPDFHVNTQGESYGEGSELIVVYDGGDHRRFFTLDEYDYESCELIQTALGALGMRLEECTGWYAAVYKD